MNKYCQNCEMNKLFNICFVLGSEIARLGIKRKKRALKKRKKPKMVRS